MPLHLRWKKRSISGVRRRRLFRSCALSSNNLIPQRCSIQAVSSAVC